MGGDVDGVLEQLRGQLRLDSETEHLVIEEIRTHFEDAVSSAMARGVRREEALAAAVARFDPKATGRQLDATHAGWGTAEGVMATGLPVVCALVLRWLVFAPGGATVGWQQVLLRPAFWMVSVAALVIPLLKFSRWRHALASWAFFWFLSLVSMLLPGSSW